jgi:hypothetical protein
MLVKNWRAHAASQPLAFLRILNGVEVIDRPMPE